MRNNASELKDGRGGGAGKPSTVIDPPNGSVNVADRRKNPRCAFTAAATTFEPGSGARIDARTTDLSRGGCYVDTMNPFPEGTEVQLRLTKEGRSFSANARVAYCQAGVGMGVIIASAEPEQLATLEKWLAELQGERPAEQHVLPTDEPDLYIDPSKSEEHYILEELLVLMMRKGIITEEDAEPLLHRLLH